MTDNNGNTSSASSTITVQDNVPPVALALDLTIQLDASGNASITPQDVDNGGNDACGIEVLALDIASFSCADMGSNTVTLTVTDNNGNTSSASSTITVQDNVPPVALAQNLTIQLDASGNAAITPQDVDDGSNDACGIASLALDVSTFTCADVGSNTVTLTVTDNNGNTSSATSTITVQDNVPPVALAQDLTIQLDALGNAAITPQDVDNGSNDACGIASLALDVSTFTCADVGSNTVTLTVTDNNGNTSSASSTITVQDNVPPVALAQDLTIQLDASGNASITPQDVDNGSNDACGIEVLSLDVSSFNCADVGQNTVTLTVTDNNSNTSSASSTITVQDNVPPVALAQDLTVQLDALGNAAITPQDVDNGSNDACGIEVLALDISSFSCADVGQNTVTLTVTDNNGNTSSASSTITVFDNVPPVVLTMNLTLALDATGSASITVQDIDDGSNDACGIASLELDITSFDCADVGNNTVILTATDVNGNVSSSTATVSITNDIPEITSVTLPVGPVHISQTVSGSASFIDSNPASATWDWGDGFTSNGAISVGTITGNHDYDTPGLYRVSLTLEDVCGEQDIEVIEYVVIYDPDGGFVTGGGWIQSPPGSYTADPGYTGKATFGLVAQYKKGAYIPTGNTEFKIGNLKFKSTSYEWLVIAGDKVKYKGKGTIDGAGDYGFQLSAIDGDMNGLSDMFRIKIWDEANGGVICDSQRGYADDSDVATQLGGGQITIHEGNKNKKSNFPAVSAPNIEWWNLETTVYPNPFNSVLKIDLGLDLGDIQEKYSIRVMNLNGVIVFTEEIVDLGHRRLEFDLDKVSPGMYIVLVSGDDNVYKTFKVTKK